MLPILRRITFWLRRPSPVRTQTTVTTSTQTSGECLSCTMTYRKHSPQNHGLYEICSFEGQTQMVYWRDGVAKPCVSTTLPVHQECSTSYWFRPRPFLMEKNPCLLEIATIFLGGQMAQNPRVLWIEMVTSTFHCCDIYVRQLLSFQRTKYLLCNLFPQKIDTFRESQLQHWIHWPGAFSESPKKPPAPKVL